MQHVPISRARYVQENRKMRFQEAYDGWSEGRLTQAEAACWRRLQIDPVCRFHVAQRDDLEPVGGLEIAATKGGAVKSRRLGQICVGANTLSLDFQFLAQR